MWVFCLIFDYFFLRFWSSVPWNQSQILLEQTITGVVLCLWRRFIFVSCFLSPAECEAVKCLLPRVCSSSSQTVAASVCRVSNRLHTLQHAVFLEEGTQRRFPAPFTQGFSLMSRNNRDAGKPERSTVINNNNNNNDDLSGQTLKSPLIGPR